MTRSLFYLALVPSVILHEISHGLVALWCGDDTAKRAGRLSLNPIRHIDPFGTVILPGLLILAGSAPFGWAKPVPVNIRQLRNPRQQSLLVSLAGPTTNLLLSFVALVALRVLAEELLLEGRSYRIYGDSTAAEMFYALGLVNVLLAVFNLIPIPPLDGSAMIERVLPRSWWPGWLRFRQYSMGLLLLVVLVFPDVFWRVLEPALDLWDRLVL